MIRALTLIVALATSARTDAVLCSSLGEKACTGCTAEGVCVWTGQICSARTDSPACGEEDVVLLDACEDSSSWYVKKENKNCEWVSKNEKRCKKTAKVAAAEACPFTCDASRRLSNGDTEACADSLTWQYCGDSTSWEFEAGKDCAWVVEKLAEIPPDNKCLKVDPSSNITAKDACFDACGNCPGNRGCPWIALEPETRCDKKDAAGEKAKRACPVACDECAEDEIGASGDDDAFDSESWYFKKADQGCDWLGTQSAAKLRKLCKKTGKEPAEAACAASCGDCADDDGGGGGGGGGVCYGTWAGLETALNGWPGNEAEVGDINTWDTSCMESMDNVFNHRQDFNGDISAWDVSAATKLDYAFYHAFKFNGDLGAWDVSSMTSMRMVFWSAKKYEGGDLRGWDVSKVVDMHQMFYFYWDSVFNGDVSTWNVGEVRDMEGMFRNAVDFNADVSSWDTSSAETMWEMFYQAKAFNADVGAWDVSKVTDLSWMFYFALEFNRDLDWSTGSATAMNHMFRGYAYAPSSFNGDISTWDASAVTTFTYMFEFTTAYNSPMNDWDVSSVQDFSWMFDLAEAFNQDISNWDLRSATDINHMFYSATSFRQDLGWCVPNDVFEDSWYDGSNCRSHGGGVCGVHFGSRQSDGSISC